MRAGRAILWRTEGCGYAPEGRSLAARLAGHRRLLVVACLLAGAVLLRVDGIARPSLASRELHNALLAREYYFGDGVTTPAWKQRVLSELRRSVKPVEPPVLDHLAAWEYRLTGGEHLWAPRLVSALLWVVGGIFLYLLALRVTTAWGAIVALALYLFWPYGVVMSRLYMPDPMMVALILAAALTVVRYWERRSPALFAVAAGTAALATAAKPGIALIFLVALFAMLAASQRCFWHTLLRGRLLLFAVAAAAPTVAYVVYGTYIHHFLESQGDAGSRLQPQLVGTAHFWRGWWEQLSIVLTFPQRQHGLAFIPLLAAVVGLAVIRDRHGRAIVAGLGLGYVAYAVAVAGYTPDNAYYALPVFPILALAVGALAGAVVTRSTTTSRAAFATTAAIVAAIVLIGGYKSRPAAPNWPRIDAYRRIGELTGHTTRAIIIDDRLSAPGMYWGWIVGSYWYLPSPAQDLVPSGDPFPPWVDARRSSYLVVLDVSELRSEGRLRAFVRGLPVVADTSRYAVFDLTGGRAVAAAKRTSRQG